MDLAKSRPDRFCRIPAIPAVAGVLQVAALSRAQARFSIDSLTSPKNLETEMWSEQDLKFQPRFSSARLQPIVPFSVREFNAVR